VHSARPLQTPAMQPPANGRAHRVQDTVAPPCRPTCGMRIRRPPCNRAPAIHMSPQTSKHTPAHLGLR
jgi:hypothetical protein